jgi:hypothetical protein
VKLFDNIFTPRWYEQERNDREAVACAGGMCWDEIEVTEQDKPEDSRFITSTNGVGVWYDYGADYYFFEDEADE